jgi:CHAT domain-containing protein/tetratricopeptide (TPR) repeat protein
MNSRLAITFVLLLAGSLPADSSPMQALRQGVVVEEVSKGSAGELANLHDGDIVQSWARGEIHGEIQSPFDLSYIEIEQGPRGNVILEGLRDTEKKTWTLGAGKWGVKGRPQISGSLLSLYRQGQEMARAGKLAEAAETWKTAADQAKDSTVIWFLYRTASMWAYARQWEAADKAYQEAVTAATEAGPAVCAQLFQSWADSYKSRSDWKNAEALDRRSLEESKKIKAESLTIAKSLDDLGTILQEQTDPKKAEAYHQQALDLRQKLAPESLDVASSLNKLGNVAWMQGDLAKAEEYHRQALDLRQKLASRSLDVAFSFNNLGLVALERRDLAEAEDFFLQALKIKEELAAGSLIVATTLTNLGSTAAIRGELAKAEEYLHQALNIKQRLAPDSLDVARTLDNLGNVAWNRGDVGKAEEYFRQALEIQEKLAPGSLNVSPSLSNLGYVARNRGQLAKGGEYYRRALDIQEKLAPESMEAAESYNNLADIAREQNDLRKAEEYYRKALTIRSKLAPESSEHAESLASLAGILRRNGQTDSATQLYEQALKAFENQIAHLGGAEETRSNFRSNHASYFRNYIDLLMIEKKPDLAFHVAESWRARLLLEMLAEAHVDVSHGVDPELHSRERLLQGSLRAKLDRRIRLLTAERVDEKQVAELEKEITDLRNQTEYLEGRIRAASPVYAALTHPQPLTVAKAQQLLDNDTVLLEYSLGEKRSYVWTVTRYSLHSYALPSGKKIETLARQLRRLVLSFRSSSLAKSQVDPVESVGLKGVADSLSRMLLAPVVGEIAGKRLLIVSDGALQYVPFAVLPVPGKPGDMPLIEEHEIVYVPSASVLSELRREASKRTLAPRTVAVLADPVFDLQDPRVPLASRSNSANLSTVSHRSSLPSERLTRSVADVGLAHLSRLAFSHREADAIMAVTPAGQGRAALGFDADRATATSPELIQYRILHFATHALSDNRNPELSGLVLSLVDRQGNAQDGFLDLQTIYNLHLPAELVVLSACETALGKEVAGEGLVGLTRAFMYAGATRVVASLWNVDDVSTKQLMKSFYRAMEQKGMRPAAALRAAQVELWRDPRWRYPYYWAAFQIQGEWK